VHYSEHSDRQTVQKQITQVALMTEYGLRAGASYWVIATLNPDAELWTSERMPARFAGYVGGEPTWNFLGSDGVSDWPVGWVGPEIVA
jgi:hypothetical protein